MLRRVWEYTIVALIAINVIELGVSFKLRSDTRLYRLADQFPIPSGYLANGNFKQSEAHRCFVLRVSSDDCSFCKLDEAQYVQLVQQATAAGCETVLFTPKVEKQKSEVQDGDVMHFVYVDMDLGKTLIPFLTPETILLDRTRRVAWYQEGAMDDRGLSDALRALHSVVN